jgi:hypothetical protein
MFPEIKIFEFPEPTQLDFFRGEGGVGLDEERSLQNKGG